MERPPARDEYGQIRRREPHRYLPALLGRSWPEAGDAADRLAPALGLKLVTGPRRGKARQDAAVVASNGPKTATREQDVDGERSHAVMPSR
jgi:hypothetical protein